MEMLSTCDGRLQALMAEANLLGEADLSSQADMLPEDAELRQAFASTLIESGVKVYHAFLNMAWRMPSFALTSGRHIVALLQVLSNC